jgi:7,8-dihydropterin-6-yl-methyl-4-(beta-D-ribofuranosyl)aminobenzene 5'-phosphate synthase
VKIYAPQENFGVFGAALPGTFYKRIESLPADMRYFDGKPQETLHFGSPWPEANFTWITKTTEVGPLKATIKVWPAKPTLGDAIYARLEIEAPAGVSIDAPFQEAGDQRLGRFRVVGFTTRDTQRKPDGGQLQAQTYTLEAPSSGRQRIPPLRLR